MSNFNDVHGQPLLPKMMSNLPFPQTGSYSPPPQQQPLEAPKNEIETFNRRYIPLFLFLISLVSTGFLGHTLCEKMYYDYDGYDRALKISTVALLVIVHLAYTLTMILAPRFLYRGIVWLKALPWIISGLGILTLQFMITSEDSFWITVSCGARLFFLLIQFILCVIRTETPVTFIFKPFSREIVPNLMAKIDLMNPNAGLDNLFGPPVMIPSGIPGQQPAIIRYGSQATGVINPQMMYPHTHPHPRQQFIPQQMPQYPSEKSAYGEYLVMKYQPMQYAMNPSQQQQFVSQMQYPASPSPSPHSSQDPNQIPAYQPPAYELSAVPQPQPQPQTSNFSEKSSSQFHTKQ